MGIVIREYQTEDVTAAITIWNQVVEDGVAFPQEENLTEETGDAFFKEQTYTGIAVNTDNNEIVGLYILHPNNVGRCGWQQYLLFHQSMQAAVRQTDNLRHSDTLALINETALLRSPQLVSFFFLTFLFSLPLYHAFCWLL